MSIKLSDKAEDKDHIDPKKIEASSDDRVHQENEALSSDVAQHNAKKKGCQCD